MLKKRIVAAMLTLVLICEIFDASLVANASVYSSEETTVVQTDSTETENIEIENAEEINGPGVAQNVQAVVGECEVTLTWSAGADAVGYSVFAVDMSTGKKTFVGSTRKTSYQITDIAGNTTHYYVIRSYSFEDGQTLYSDYTEPVAVTPTLLTPGTVTDFTAIADEGEVTLTWTATENATGYTIFVVNPETGTRKSVGSTRKTSYTLTDLDEDVEYIYQIRTYRKVYTQVSYSDFSESISTALVKVVPGVAKDIQVTAGEYALTLTWKAATDATGYSVFVIDTETGTRTFVGSTRNTTYTISNLDADVEYTYQIRTYRKNDVRVTYSEFSESVSGTALKINPGVAQDVVATAGEHSITFTWTAAENATGYTIFVVDPETGARKSVGSTRNTTFTVTGLEGNVEYIYQIRTYRKVSDRVTYSEFTEKITAVPTEIVPSKPKNFKATAGDNQVTLTWTAVTDATGYSVFYYDTETGEKTYIGSTSKTSYTVSGLTNKTTYTFIMYAYRKVNGFVNYSKLTASVSATPVMTLPTAPTSLTVTYSSSNNNLTWTAVSKATGYYVYLYNYTTSEYELLATVTTNSYVHKGEGKTGKYKYMIKTYRIDDDGELYVSDSGLEKIVFGASDVESINSAVHAMYYSATVNQGTRLYSSFSATTKCGTIAEGAKVTVTYRRSKRSTILYNGTKYYIKTSALTYTAEHYTSSDYTTEQKELFVNSKGYTSDTEYLIWVSTYTQKVNVYKGSEGEWTLIKSYTCATGKMATPTPPGVYSIYDHQEVKKYSTCSYSYWSKFNSSNSFHQRGKYYSTGAYVDSRLGMPLSSGCVRLEDAAALYIYNKIPLGTTVIIY